MLAADSGSHLQVLIPLLLISMATLQPLVAYWREDWCFYVALGATGLASILAWSLFWQVAASDLGYLDYFLGHSWSGERLLSSGEPIGLVLRSDVLGCLLVLLICVLGALTTLFSLKYIPHQAHPEKRSHYYCLLLLLLAGMCGIALTGDCFNFYVFLEVASISAYGLVGISHMGESLEATLKYMLIGAFSSILVLFGIVLLFSATGSLNMAFAAQQISRIMKAANTSSLYNLRYLVFASLGMFTVGLSIKSAFFPTHAWLADAHPMAPSPVSALLSSLVVKTTGVFLLIRFLFSVFAIQSNQYGNLISPLFMTIAVITTIGGSIFAIAQSNLKRMLAYSTVAQMGYILIGISLVTPSGLTGSIIHIFNHALIKALLFLCAGAIVYKTGIRHISQMEHLAYRMPLTMGCFTIGALAIVGIPPLNGFMSKWSLAVAAFESGMPLLVVILLISGLLNAIYYFRVIAIAYFSVPDHGTERPACSEVPWQMSLPMVLLTIAVVYFGFKIGLLRTIARQAVHVIW